MKQQINLSVVSCGSIDNNWEKKPQKPIISKIIRRDVGNYAIILTQDPSKPIRFLYLTLLTEKNRIQHLKAVIIKIKRLAAQKKQINFEDITVEMKQIGTDLDNILKNLKILQAKMQKEKDDQLIIAKLCEEHATVDPLLVMAFRAIASSPQCRIKGALSCQTPMSLVNIYQILRKFGINKDEKNQLNRFVIFYDLKQIDIQFFKQQGISIENQVQNCQQLFDAYLLKYEDEIILEQLYCQL